MNFQFESLSDFIAMAGHGPYVWASYAVTIIALLMLVIVPYQQKKQWLKKQHRIQTLAQQQAVQQERSIKEDASRS